MKRLASTILAMIIIICLCTTTVTAVPGSDKVRSWVLSDNGKNICIEIIQYPEVTISSIKDSDGKMLLNVPLLNEIILKMDIISAQKYLQNFKSGQPIQELALTGITEYKTPKLKLTLEDCTICGYSISEISQMGVSNPVRVTIKIDAARITTAKLGTGLPPLQVEAVKNLNWAKIFINDSEQSDFYAFSGIDGYLMSTGDPGEKTYGGAFYKESELMLNYNEIGTLPDWLADTEGQDNYTINPQCKIKYELSSTTSDGKLSFEVTSRAAGQGLTTSAFDTTPLAKYKLRIFDFNFLAPSAAASTATPPVDTAAPAADAAPAASETANNDAAAVIDTTRIAPVSPLIRGISPIRALEQNWSGNWITTFGKMTLKQEGTKVTGEYGKPVETLEGTVTGNKLAGTWRDSVSSGKFEFTMADDGKSFKGYMYNNSLGDRGTFEWNGDRVLSSEEVPKE